MRRTRRKRGGAIRGEKRSVDSQQLDLLFEMSPGSSVGRLGRPHQGDSPSVASFRSLAGSPSGFLCETTFACTLLGTEGRDRALTGAGFLWRSTVLGGRRCRSRFPRTFLLVEVRPASAAFAAVG